MPLTVVNVIPQVLSSETRQDSECSVAVNPRDPQQVALTAFTVDPASSGNAPIFVSTDGGTTWALSVCVPGGNSTGDISVRFGQATGTLYAAILRGDNSSMSILRATGFPPVGIMATLVNRGGPDQPWVETAAAGAADRVIVSMNTGTAEAQFSLDAATAAAPAGFGGAVDIEARAGSNRPSVRTAIHRAGVVYGMFVGVRPAGSDIVVIRDDNWGQNGWANLADPGDGLAGRRVVTGATVPPVGTLLGSVRVSSRLAIAVDPRDRRRVYIAWCDGAVTAASPYTLHVRRSDDGGANWTPDLRTIANVTNPCLAINVRGTVALLYQQLTAPAAPRWSTRLELSDDHLATVRSTLLVASPRDLGGTFQPTIGDYANLIAVGKDFYGAFSAFNQPIAADFFPGTTFLRNADWANQRLLGIDGTTVIPNSIDPFYLHYTDVETHDDVYVRDWTDGPGAGDSGIEPSTHPAFWATSDVWNRRGTNPGTFPGDQPDNEPAGNGTGTIGDNWAFARICRRAAAPAGSADINVTAHFLVSKLGTGSNFVDASSADPDVSFPDPDPVVTFAASDGGPTTTASFRWHLNPVTSTHLCLAVEVSTPKDPYAGASLRGRAPGWPDQDLEILDDNNKAQRNMGLSVTPARGVESCESVLYALAHNAATSQRDMEIEYSVPSATFERIGRLRLEAQGLRRISAKQQGRFVLRAMEPGEHRWIGMGFVPPTGGPAEIHAVDFFEVVDEARINGFSLGARLDSDRAVAAHVVERSRSIFTRLAAGWGGDTDAEIEWAGQLRNRTRNPDRVTGALVERWPRISELLTGLVPDANLDIKRAVAAVNSAVRREAADLVVCYCSLLERVDMALTLDQLVKGDRADIAQTIRWQAEVLAGRERRNHVVADLNGSARDFLDRFSAGQVNFSDYPAHLIAQADRLLQLRAVRRRAEFERLVGDVRSAVESGDLDAMQKAHRLVVAHLAGSTA